MNIIEIVLIIALAITIVIALMRHVKADKYEAKTYELEERKRKQSDALREKGITIDRLTKDLAKYQREEDTKTGEQIRSPELNKRGKQFHSSFKKAFPGFSTLIEVEAFVNKLVMDSDLPINMKLEVLKIIKRELAKYRKGEGK